MKGDNIPDPGIPESFKVLLKELQSLSLDVKVLTSDSKEVEIREELDDATDLSSINLQGRELDYSQNDSADEGSKREKVIVDDYESEKWKLNDQDDEKLEDSFIIQDKDELFEEEK